MPTYQYACTECGHAFEAVQSFTDDALTVCTRCDGRLRKVFSSVGIVFKGSGFYRNDSREAAKNGSSNGDKADKGDKPAKSDKSDKVSADKGSDPKKADSPAADRTKGDKPVKKSESGGSSSPAKTPAASGSSTQGSAA